MTLAADAGVSAGGPVPNPCTTLWEVEEIRLGEGGLQGHGNEECLASRGAMRVLHSGVLVRRAGGRVPGQECPNHSTLDVEGKPLSEPPSSAGWALPQRGLGALWCPQSSSSGGCLALRGGRRARGRALPEPLGGSEPGAGDLPGQPPPLGFAPAALCSPPFSCLLPCPHFQPCDP